MNQQVVSGGASCLRAERGFGALGRLSRRQESVQNPQAPPSAAAPSAYV